MRSLLFLLMLCLPGVAFANARLDIGCSAALFEMAGMDLDQKALILTAGHCANLGDVSVTTLPGLTFPAPGQVFVNQPKTGEVAVRGTGGKFHNYRAGRLILATMTEMDVAVIELDTTYRALLAGQPDAEIYELSPIAPWAGAAMHVISANKKEDFTCAVDRMVPTIKEGLWTWTNLIRFRLSASCTFYPGISGSPVLDRHHRIVGVANTVTDPGEPCDLDAPCEIYPGSAPVIAPAGQSYAIATDRLYDCYSAARRTFDFSLPTCTLVPPDRANALAGPATPAAAATRG